MRSGMSKVVSLLTIVAALALSSDHVFAKTAGPGKAQTSGTSAAQGGKPAGGSVARRPAGCGHHTTGACAIPPAPGRHKRQRPPRSQPGTGRPRPSPEIGFTAR